MITWERIPLADKTFVPKIYGSSIPVKSVQLQHFLILFNPCGKSSERIVVFDLKENKWLKVRLEGDYLELGESSSVCSYDNSTVIIFGASSGGNEDILSLLSFCRGNDCLELSCSSLNSLKSNRDSSL